MRAGGGTAWGGGGMHKGGPDSRLSGQHRAGAERTRNISTMFVTLDVSKLNNWLNAEMPCPCRESQGGHAMRGRGAGRGRREGGVGGVGCEVVWARAEHT